MYCKKCLTGRSGDVVGEPCQTAGCDGTIEDEPVFSTLVDTLPEPMTCGRRFDVHGDLSVYNMDRWERFKSNGNRVCSYCGSLHPDDFLALVSLAANAPEDAEYGSVPEIEPSDKNYKIYVRQPGVRNAYDGGIKFYTQHLPHTNEGKLDVSPESQAEYGEAVRRSSVRFKRYIAA